MRTTILTLAYTLIAVTTIAIGGIIIWNKPLPKGQENSKAEALTDSIMAAVNCEAWDRLRFVAWNYDGRRNYVWDKLYNLAEVRYGNTRVLLNLNVVDGIVWKHGKRLPREEKREDIQKAWEYWCNDAFWLNPVCKLRDTGTVRKIVTLPDKSRGLLVTYTRGGVNPGDSYLWMVDDNFLPRAWRMWVRILPIRGLKATWEEWAELEECKISLCHHIGPYRIAIQNLKSGRHHSELGLHRDPFIDFVTE